MSFLSLSAGLSKKEQKELEEIRTPIVELEPLTPSQTQEEQSPPPTEVNIFDQGVKVDKLKKYYKRLEKNISLWIICTEIFLIALIFVGVKEGMELWGANSVSSLWTGLSKFAGQKTAQIPITIAGALFIVWNIKNLNRLIFKRRVIVCEHNLCKSKYYPTTITPALSKRILSLFSWRLNVFWLGFCLCGVGLIAMAGAHIYEGAKIALKSSETWGMGWYKNWTQFTKNNTQDWVALGGLFGIGGGGASILFTNPILRFMIKKALDIFSLNEYNMGAELREKTFRINKRNKIMCLIIVCLVGLPFYMMFKKLIIAVFHKSFKYSRR